MSGGLKAMVPHIEFAVLCLQMMDHYFLKMCSLLTFELNSDSYEFSLKHLPHVKLQGTEDLMRALDGVTWSHDLGKCVSDVMFTSQSLAGKEA